MLQLEAVFGPSNDIPFEALLSASKCNHWRQFWVPQNDIPFEALLSASNTTIGGSFECLKSTPFVGSFGCLNINHLCNSNYYTFKYYNNHSYNNNWQHITTNHSYSVVTPTENINWQSFIQQVTATQIHPVGRHKLKTYNIMWYDIYCKHSNLLWWWKHSNLLHFLSWN